MHLSRRSALPGSARRPRRRRRRLRGDLPALPDPRRRGVPDGATEFKCCPPIRDRPIGTSLVRAISGDIDFVVTDHSPSTADLKVEPATSAHAWGGIASLQLGLPAVWTAARARGAPSPTSCAGWRPRRPTGSASTTRAGSRSASRADLAVLAPDESFAVDVARLHHKNQVSAYAGRTLTASCGGPGWRVARSTTNPPRPAADERKRMNYAVPPGGLPPQTELTTDRARLHRGVRRDPARLDDRHRRQPYLPALGATRAAGSWPARSRGFAETFSHYVMEVEPGGGIRRPEPDPEAEAVLFVSSGRSRSRSTASDHDLRPGGYAYLPPGSDWSLRNRQRSAGDVPLDPQGLRARRRPRRPDRRS